MNLGEFHDRVAVALGRGTSLDSMIPNYVEEAVQQIERNYTFQYMKRWVEIAVDADADSPHIISLYATPIKRIALLRYYSDTYERYTDLKGPKDPQDRDTRPAGLPSSFWLDGVSSIVLDSVPDTDITLEGHLEVFSVWQSGQDSFQHYLIDRFRLLLLSETVLVAAIDLRDARLTQQYTMMNERAWKQVNVSEEALQYGGETGASMEWEPPYGEFESLRDNS